MSYTKDECIGNIGTKLLTEAVDKDDINSCKKLEKFPVTSTYTECVGKLANTEKLKTGDTKIESVIEALKKNPDDKTLQKELAKLKADKQTKYEMMSDADRAAYFSEKRQEIMADIEDEDVASAISKEYTKYREGEKNINNLLDRLEEITAKQQRIKQADEDANYLTDQIKEQLEWLVGEKQDEIIGEMG